MDKISIPEKAIAQYVYDIALEWGELGDVNATASEGQYGQDEYDVDWSLTDLDVDNCDVDTMNDEDGNLVVMVSGILEGTYSVQTVSARYNPPGKAHPAEHRTEKRAMEVMLYWKPERFACTDSIIIDAYPA
jgi:hypothetical protein